MPLVQVANHRRGAATISWSILLRTDLQSVRLGRTDLQSVRLGRTDLQSVRAGRTDSKSVLQPEITPFILVRNLIKHFPNHRSMHVRQPAFDAVVVIAQPLVIETEQMQNRGVQVVDAR